MLNAKRTPEFMFSLFARHRSRRVLETHLALCTVILLCAITGCGQKQPEGPSFDVPSLVNKKIGEVETQLGAAETTDAGSDSARKMWRRQGHTLTAEYLKRNGRITTFTLAPEDATQSFKEEEKAEFLKTGTLREGDARYSLDWIEDNDKVFNFSGVRVTPAPVTYQVTLRVTGSQNLVTVNYAVSGSSTNNPAEQFLTMPVWETTLSAVTGTVIKITAAPVNTPQMRTTDNTKVTAQILVNGKVAQEKTSQGGAAEISLEL
jgi:hypothetical protein